MKKINIYMSRLKYGGMELSLINFINNSNITKDNEVHLYLVYCLNNELLDQINDNVKIHLLCKGKWNLFGKLVAGIKLVWMYLFNNKSDTSICYTNHQKILSLLTRKSAKDSIIFVHSDLNRYIKDEEKQNIKSKICFDKFAKIVCVSEKVKESLVNLYSKNIANKCYVIPNYVDGNRIIKLALEEIEGSIDYSIPTFISIANHVEEYKNINSIIDASIDLKNKGYKFQVLLIGSGKDTASYMERIKSNSLENYVKVLGSKPNPYPYLKKSNALLFTSNYEGYGMVLDEARVLGVPIIATGSGASKEICNAGYGIITNDIAASMIDIINKKYVVNKDFDYNVHNENITKLFDSII